MSTALDPLAAAEQLQEAYLSYIRTAFPLRRDAVAAAFEDLVREGSLLWGDPFVSLSRPARPGATFAELVAEGTLGTATAALPWRFERLFAHQTEATRRLTGDRPANTLVATGTGSGKTESFLVPLIDHVLRAPGPGVRAVLLYPMNALANDQLGRLRRLLADCPDVTFGRYTGDTPFDDRQAQEDGRPRPSESPPNERYTREEMRGEAPNLLLTGYAMLEQLLLRSRDRQALFGAGHLRFLVVDEIHTYTGVTGAEVACLIRRLKAHAGLPVGRLVCVGTSATVRRGETGSLDDLARFASDLFGEVFEAGGVIEERAVQLPPPGAVPERRSALSPDLVRRAAGDDAALAELAEAVCGVRVDEPDVPNALGRHLAEHPLMVEMQRALESPRPLGSLVETMREWPGRLELAERELRLEALALLTIGAAARQGDESLFRPKIHLLVRSLLPVRRCLDDACGRLYPEGEPTCTNPGHDDPVATMPLATCRECGQDYWTTPEPVVDEAAVTDDDEPEQRDVFLIPSGVETRAVSDGGDDAVPVGTRAICLACGRLPASGAACECRAGLERQRSLRAFLGGRRCPVCAMSAGRPVVTPFRSGQNATVSVLVQHLMAALGEEHRRLLVFADSRQDAAQQAGYIRDRARDFTVRQLAVDTLRTAHAAGEAPTLERLPVEVWRHAADRFGETLAFNLLWPSDALGTRDVTRQGFLPPGEVPRPFERQVIQDRLCWDFMNELGPRSVLRVSLPREGLVGVRYERLEEVGNDDAALLARHGLVGEGATLAVAAVLDIFRWGRAVLYEGFQTYLAPWSDLVADGKVPQVGPPERTPVAMAEKSIRVGGAFQLRNAFAPTGSLMRLAARILGPGSDRHRREGLLRSVLQVLEGRGYLRMVEIGSRAKYGKRASGWQADPALMVVRTDMPLWRCDRCHTTRAYPLRDPSGQQVCARPTCDGRPAQRPDEAGRDYYRRLYGEATPIPLAALEHSGGVDSQRREEIERLFNQNRLNLLVCTPTLELGVDIGALESVVLRNVPPLPANYAQRAGRAGRERQVALIVAHAGKGPHDSHFFEHPEEMITGAIVPPQIELGNRVVVGRHLNSLVLEALPEDAFPGTWEPFLTDDKRVHPGALTRLHDELAGHLSEPELREGLRRLMRDAFLRHRAAGGIPELDESALDEAIKEFPARVLEGLRRWARRHDELDAELDVIPRRPTKGDERLEARLKRALATLETDRDYLPRSYLARVGVLPRYGFVGDTVAMRDESQHESTQGAAVAIAEYAPGNIVYASGRKLRVSRIVFRSSERQDPRQNVAEYRYCRTCAFVTGQLDAAACPQCGEMLFAGRYADFEAAEGRPVEAIRSTEEYRLRSSYDLHTVLGPRGIVERIDWGEWVTDLSRGRTVEIYNRGFLPGGGRPRRSFCVCLRCGTLHDPTAGSTAKPTPGAASGHARFCDVTTWDPQDDERVEPALHLRVTLQGDVLEMEVPGGLAAEHAHGDRRFVVTFAQALKLGLARERFITSREVEVFAARYGPGAAPRLTLTFHDQLPGGTGYLPWMQANLGRVARAAWEHLRACPCEASCYRCLREFWNQRAHDLLDKRLVMSHLLLLAGETDPTVIPVADLEEARLDSFLETAFWRLVRDCEVGPPTVQRLVRSPDGRRIATADFAWGDVLVFVDGYAHHAERAADAIADQERRTDLADQGKLVIELAYEDVVGAPEQTLAEIERVVKGERLAAAANGAGELTIDGQAVPVLRHELDRGLAWVDVEPESWAQDRQRWRQDLARHRLLAAAGIRVMRQVVP